jgi:predicted ribosome quality control (RQC) complex YloA/Tae2 family protein
MTGIPESSETAHRRLAALRKSLVRVVLKHLERKREKQEEELGETTRAEWYRQIADSLLAAPPPPKGSGKISLLNIHSQKEEPVSLNPKLDFRGNARLFYKKARKGTRGEEINEKKNAETAAEIDACERFIGEADVALAAPADEQRFADLCGRIESAFGAYLPRGLAAPAGPQESEKADVPYRRYTIDKWNIYVGRNDAQNDEMTVHYARPHDLWLHVVGHAGSHVLVRRPDRTSAVPDQVVRTAASLAVWFSKAKHTSYAEVHVTEARFVRKRRHAPPGEVVAERCSAVRVAPKSPEDIFPSKYA